MQKRKSFSISRISLNSNVSSLLKLLEKIYYNEESGYGVTDIEIVDEILSGSLIKKNPTYIQEYSAVDNRFEKRLIYIYITIRFYIDFEFNLLYVEGALTNLTNSKILLRNIPDLNFEIFPFDTSPFKFYRALKNKKIKFQLCEMNIEKFNYKDGAVGRYLAVISNMNVGTELIKSYQEDISKIAIIFDDYKIYFYNNSTFSIVGESDEIEKNLQHFKNIII